MFISSFFLGIVYTLKSISELCKLDEFEGVETKNYFRKSIKITIPGNRKQGETKIHSVFFPLFFYFFSSFIFLFVFFSLFFFSDERKIESITYFVCVPRLAENLKPTPEYLEHLLGKKIFLFLFMWEKKGRNTKKKSSFSSSFFFLIFSFFSFFIFFFFFFWSRNFRCSCFVFFLLVFFLFSNIFFLFDI